MLKTKGNYILGYSIIRLPPACYYMRDKCFRHSNNEAPMCLHRNYSIDSSATLNRAETTVYIDNVIVGAWAYPRITGR